MGEKYAQILIGRAAQIEQSKANRIAERLVYGYTHHLFPIDIIEARDIGLSPEEMSKDEYECSVQIVTTCTDNQVCIEFVDQSAEPGDSDRDSKAAAVPEPAAPLEA
jgi:hypothetical protein